MKKAQQISDILKKFNPVEDKYISREFQSYGIYLSEQLNDYKHRSLYIKLAKTVPRAILEKALSFVKDANADSRVKLFLWKMKELKDEKSRFKRRDTSVEKKERLHVIFSGIVQGVGFRAFCRYHGKMLKLAGWVKNLPTGEVELVSEGDHDTLLELLKSCREGPPASQVDDLDVQWEPATGEFVKFEIVK